MTSTVPRQNVIATTLPATTADLSGYTLAFQTGAEAGQHHRVMVNQANTRLPIPLLPASIASNPATSSHWTT